MNISINVVEKAVIIKSHLEDNEVNCYYGEVPILNWDKSTDTFIVSLSTYTEKNSGLSYEYDKELRKVNNVNIHNGDELCFFFKSNRQAILIASAIQVICERNKCVSQPKVEDVVSEKYKCGNPYYHYVEVIVDSRLSSLREEPKKGVNYLGAHVYISNPDKVIYKTSNTSLNTVTKNVYGSDLSDIKVSLGCLGRILGTFIYSEEILYVVSTEMGLYLCPSEALTLGIRRIKNG